MYEDCSPAVQRAITSAASWVDRIGGASLGSTHLFLGLLDDEDGRAWSLLGEHGLPLPASRDRWSEVQGSLASLAEVLTHGYELSRRHGEDATLTSEFFLLAILRTDPILTRHLEALGLRVADLEQSVIGKEHPPLVLGEPLTIVQPTDQIASGRVLDAAFNRAREALRVLEDYCRFGLDDAYLTQELKALRHELAEVSGRLPPSLLLESRETQRDVGTEIGAPGENVRHSPAQVAIANWKRLQESLRSLEEFGKLFGPEFGEALERLRYRSYTLEKAVAGAHSARQRLADARLCVLLTGAQCEAALDWTIREAAAGGAQVFQLREKDLPDTRLLERARDVRRWTREVGALFIVNDRPDIARLADADGVHLGQDDMPVQDARRILGPEALIGVSTHNLLQLRQAVLDGASYIGVGPTFPSQTKRFEEFPGLEFVTAALRETSLPAFVIGGINLDTIGAAVAAGARRIAVSSAVAQAKEPRIAAHILLSALPR